jgi:hypothetical protein
MPAGANRLGRVVAIHPRFARSSRRGIAVIWVAIVLMVMIGVIGLALDTGYTVLVGNQLQAAADAGALAGARTVGVAPTGCKTAAVTIADLNSAAGLPVQIDINADVTVGHWDLNTRTFTSPSSSSNAVRVRARRVTGYGPGPVPLFFGSIFGVNTIDMSRTATAMANVTYSPALVVLDPTGSCSLDVGGGGVLTVPGSAIQVNSTATTAACFSGAAMSSSTYLNVTGGVSGATHFTGTIATGVPPLPDPLGALPAPPRGPPLGSRSIGRQQNITLDPGYYNGGLTVQGTLHLNPGIYIIGGTGLRANSAANIIGQGVMIYITDGAAVNMNSSSTRVTLSPPDPTRDTFPGADIYAGVSMFQDRVDTAQASLPLSGSFNISGTLYFPSADIRVTAGGSQTGVSLICYDLTMRGNSALNLVAPNGIVNSGVPFLVE